MQVDVRSYFRTVAKGDQTVLPANPEFTILRAMQNAAEMAMDFSYVVLVYFELILLWTEANQYLVGPDVRQTKDFGHDHSDIGAGHHRKDEKRSTTGGQCQGIEVTHISTQHIQLVNWRQKYVSSI